MEYKFEKPVRGEIGSEKYKCTIRWRNGTFISDEPESSGGKDAGPDPHTLLLSALASCTLTTMRMYIDRKGWDIPEMAVNVNMYEEKTGSGIKTIIDRDIIFLSGTDDEKKLRLQEIAKHCPISKILQGDTEVRTFLYRDNAEVTKVNYSNDDITVVWKPELCQHSKRCFTQLPEVFDPNLRKWIKPNGASSEKIIEQVGKCPSGALSIKKKENNK